MRKEVNIYNSTVSYTVDVRKIKHPRLEFRKGELEVIVPEDYGDELKLIEKHKNWIHRKRKEILTSLNKSNHKKLNSLSELQLKELVNKTAVRYSKELKVSFDKIYFRDMRSKWASCSSNRNLTVNTLVSYLPEHLIKYIIFHELVHRIERKHNARFWKRISKKFDNFERNEKELFTYWFLIREKIKKKPL